MKKSLAFIGIILILFTLTLHVFAGDVPEALNYEDNALLYVGTLKDFETDVTSSAPKVTNVTVIPTYKIKGDVPLNELQSYEFCYFGTVKPEKEKEYLFGWLGENSVWVFGIESHSENQIKLEITDAFSERIQNYLDEGLYERGEQERLNIGNKISFLEFLYNEPSFSSSPVEKVTLRYQDDLCEVNKDEFFKVAENIMITDVKNGLIYETGKDDSYKTVLYIELLDKNDKIVYFSAVSRFGEVDKYSLSMSRMMSKDYEMNAGDLSKLYSLFPEDVQKRIKAPENLPGSSDNALTLPETNQKDYTWILVTTAIAVFVIGFASGFIVKMKKKK